MIYHWYNFICPLSIISIFSVRKKIKILFFFTFVLYSKQTYLLSLRKKEFWRLYSIVWDIPLLSIICTQNRNLIRITLLRKLNMNIFINNLSIFSILFVPFPFFFKFLLFFFVIWIFNFIKKIKTLLTKIWIFF